jgi:hypothetical protein
MSDTSAILSLPYIQPAQAQKHVTHNEALHHLELLVQLSVTDRARSDPPAALTDGVAGRLRRQYLDPDRRAGSGRPPMHLRAGRCNQPPDLRRPRHAAES